MEFVYGKNDWKTLRRGQEKSYLLTNSKAGYSALSMIGSCSRGEHNLFMACIKAPNTWVQMITKMEEIIQVGGKTISTAAQEYVSREHNEEGQKLLQGFTLNEFPQWHYGALGVEIKREVVMKHEENLLLINYELVNQSSKKANVILKPWMRFTPKGEMPNVHQEFLLSENGDEIKSNGYTLYCKTDGKLVLDKKDFRENLYFEDDAKDGKVSIGSMVSTYSHHHELKPKETKKVSIIYSMAPIKDSPESIRDKELTRFSDSVKKSGMKSDLGKRLAIACDQFVVDRESTGAKTIIAGYPFFGDWGRDTMIAALGCTIATGRQDDTKSMFRTFISYLRNGLMPNMFPEGDQPPLYNTVDASLLFIYAVHEYYQEFKDLDFINEVMEPMMDIIHWYKKGTDFHIRMEEDGLISAGADFEQVTWMDIRIEDVLPTPRHGKPVEINAYWYNALRIVGMFSKMTNKGDYSSYENLAEKVKASFLREFWNPEENCLKDVISNSPADYQVRCNQIWAVSMPFSILPREKEMHVVEKVYAHLYTPYGLRSLSPEDPEYKPFYGGTLWKRDLAYHQGTVWAFPLGGYYLAYLKVHDYSEVAARKVMEDLSLLKGTLGEGCLGQIAEIFDGDNPEESKGCFAQAWSTGELLRALKKAEQIVK